MLNRLNIVHISPTPLVAAPGKISEAQRLIGHNSIHIALNDYPSKGPLAGKFLDNSILPSSFTNEFIENSIINADIIHIHNDLNKEWVYKISCLNQTARFIYHVHSPLREGPLYIDRSSTIDLPFHKKLVVGQHWSRFYPDHTPVPNIILESPHIQLIKKDEKLRVMFSPTHKHDGRWTNKHSEILNETLISLVKLRKIILIQPESPVHPKTLITIRKSCHISIDEIATGGFHQVSLEAMCAGNIAINNTDYFAKVTFAQFCDGELPPFVCSGEDSISEILLNFADDYELTQEQQKKSFDYFSKYLRPERLARIYDVAYE